LFAIRNNNGLYIRYRMVPRLVPSPLFSVPSTQNE